MQDITTHYIFLFYIFVYEPCMQRLGCICVFFFTKDSLAVSYKVLRTNSRVDYLLKMAGS